MATRVLNLLNGVTTELTAAEEAHEDRMTALTKKRLGECDYACRYAEPFGWVPEADCPIHDRDC